MPKKNSNSPEFSHDREFAVILERLEGNFKVFGEGQMSLKKEVDGMKETLGRTLERITMVELRMTSLDSRMGSLETRMGSWETRMDSLENTTDKILADTTEIKKAVSNHENRIKRLETAKA